MSNQLKSNELLHIATLGKSVGLKGFMKLHVISDFPELFHVGKSFLLDNNQNVTIEAVDKNLVKLQGVNSPEAAKSFVNKRLLMSYQHTRENCLLKQNQYFYFDIIGLHVVENNQHLGIVSTIDRIADIDYLLIKTDASFVTKKLPKSFLIPYQDKFIVHVDINNETILVSGGLDILEAS